MKSITSRAGCISSGQAATYSSYSQQGFSLIEAIVSIAVLVILGAFAIPAMQDTRASIQLRGMTGELVGSINMARSQSVSLRIPVLIQPIDDDWTNGWEIVYQYPAAIPAAERSESDKTYAKPGDVDVDKTGGPDDMQFQPTGLLTGGPTQFDLCAANGVARTLNISTFGRVTNTDGVCDDD